MYVDDDHAETNGWIAADKWLALANVEYAQLYRRWVRMGLIAAAWVDLEFTGPELEMPYQTGVDEEDEPVYAKGVLTVIGVVEDLGGGQLRTLEPVQSALGRNPWWNTSTASPASKFRATGAGDELTVTIEPPDTGSYILRYIPTVDYATSAAATVELPYGCDERLVLGIARRAKLKDGTASALLERLLEAADAELAFLSFGRLNSDSPRVRRLPR